MKFLQGYAAIIFDMDGLLIDSERIYLECFTQACQEYNHIGREEIYLRCVGTSWQKTREVLLTGYGPTFPYDAIIERCRNLYDAHLGNQPVPLKDGVFPLLKMIQQLAIPAAVATSTEQKKAIAELDSVRLLPFFTQIVGGDQVHQSKPAPDIYQHVAASLNVQPDTCLALEDSDNGVRAAHAAGMDVIQIPDLVNPSSPVVSLGHRILPSLRDVLELR